MINNINGLRTEMNNKNKTIRTNQFLLYHILLECHEILAQWE